MAQPSLARLIVFSLVVGNAPLMKAGAPATVPSGMPMPTTVRVIDVTAAHLVVHVVGARNQKGDMRLGVFDSTGAAGFPTERSSALLWRSLPANSVPLDFSLDLPPGRYAIVVLHDVNSNKKLDRNLIGVPMEGSGVTNNPKPHFRASTFGEGAFDLAPGAAEMTVSLQYDYL